MANKIRTRICLKDIYRYIVTGEKVAILGLTDFVATRKEIRVMYEGERVYTKFKTIDENDRHSAITTINKYISEVH